MKNAVIYTRSASPNEQAIKAQLQICREYACSHGYNVVGEFSDNGYSGMSFGRPSFIPMNDIRNNWETVIVYSMNKLSRKMDEFYKYRKNLLDEGKEIISISEPFSNKVFTTIDSLLGLYADNKRMGRGK